MVSNFNLEDEMSEASAEFCTELSRLMHIYSMKSVKLEIEMNKDCNPIIQCSFTKHVSPKAVTKESSTLGPRKYAPVSRTGIVQDSKEKLSESVK